MSSFLFCSFLFFLAAKGKVGGGGSSTCIAWLALVGIDGVLGVVRWRGNWRQCWGIGDGAPASGRQRLFVDSCASAGLLQVGAGREHWRGLVRSGINGGALSQRWHRHAGDGGGTQQST